MEPRIYAILWNKYRPAILQLMSAAEGGPQQYKFSRHEFQSLNPRQKTGFAFTLQATKGKSVNNIRGNTIARELLEVLQQSKRALELMNTATYELTLDKKFVLHINRKEEIIADPVSEEVIAS